MQFNVKSAAIAASKNSDVLDALKNFISVCGIDPENDPATPAAAWGNNGKAVVGVSGAEWERTAAEIIYTRKCHFGASVSGHKVPLELRHEIERSFEG